jgi:aminomethyltransferase
MIEGAKILSPSGEETLGIITSGIPSPTLGKNISMGYIKSGWHKKGTEVAIEVRKQLRKAVTTSIPFSKTNYWRG